VRLIGLALFGLAVAFACFLPILGHSLGANAPFRTAGALFLPIPTVGFHFQIWFNRRHPRHTIPYVRVVRSFAHHVVSRQGARCSSRHFRRR
jgi:hypothetical protein